MPIPERQYHQETVSSPDTGTMSAAISVRSTSLEFNELPDLSTVSSITSVILTRDLSQGVTVNKTTTARQYTSKGQCQLL